MEGALASGASHVLLTAGDRGRIEEALLRRPAAPADAPDPAPRPARETAPADGDPAGDLRGPAEEFLRGLLAAELKMAADDIAADESFEHYGIDSLLVLSLTRELERHFGPLSKTLFFEYLTVAELAEFLVEQHGETLRELIGPRRQDEPQPSAVANAAVPASAVPASAVPASAVPTNASPASAVPASAVTAATATARVVPARRPCPRPPPPRTRS
ncbi:acyl carrier protein [Streptomyces sp. FXJ1.4098]|nr:acyl carrier protein [Streptomyces sp. FXJ1.4098]